MGCHRIENGVILVDERMGWIDPNVAAHRAGRGGALPVIELDAVEAFFPDAILRRTRRDGSVYRTIDANVVGFGFNWHEADNAVLPDPDIDGGNCWCGKWKCPGCGSLSSRVVRGAKIQPNPNSIGNGPGGPTPPGGCSQDPQIRAGQCLAGYLLCCDEKAQGVIQDALKLLVPHSGQDSGCALHESECPEIVLSPVDRFGGLDVFRMLKLDLPPNVVTGTFASDCHLALVAKAWNLLLLNIDLIQWAECIVRGQNRDCVTNTIERADAIIKVDEHARGIFEFLQPCRHGNAFESFKLLGIEICDDPGFQFHTLTQAFCCPPKEPSETVHNELCATIDLAAAFAHESVHLCLIGEPGEGECGKAYLFENLVRWALFQRFPAALDSSCCARYLDIPLQNWDRSEKISGDCFDACR